MAELSTAEQAAYNASFNKTKKQAARDKGAADAGGWFPPAEAPAIGHAMS